jgi:hypothetical protein
MKTGTPPTRPDFACFPAPGGVVSPLEGGIMLSLRISLLLS